MNTIPVKVDFTLNSEISKSFRCKMAADSLDIDVNKKSEHHMVVSGINIPDDWNVGVVYGASGSGKTTLIKHIFGDKIFSSPINPSLPIIDQFDKKYKYEECANMLNGIGLTSVPCWIRPVKTLSNGQTARAEAALLMSQDKEIVLVDEWTSVVDRTVAKAMSHCVQKFAKKFNKKIILLSCHNDILEWVRPDWVIDCNKQEFMLPKGDGFFLKKKKNSNSQSGKLTGQHGSILASITI
jgi:ABC-type ATPase with predicted acetyltransferase domain